MAYQPLKLIQYQIVFIHIYYIYMICKYISMTAIVNEPELFFFLHAVQSFLVLQYNTNNPIYRYLFIYLRTVKSFPSIVFYN